MALYLKPVSGIVSLKSLEKFALKRMRFLLQLYATRPDREKQLEVLGSAATAVDADCLIEGSAKDSISHFILRLLLSRDAELREFFLTAEVDFFSLRLCTMSRSELTAFFRRLEEKVGSDVQAPKVFLPHLAGAMDFLQLMVRLKPHGETWKSLISKFFQGLECPQLFLPWTAVAALVARRDVDLHGGTAVLPLSSLQTASALLYQGILSLGLARARQCHRRMTFDPRMDSLAQRLKSLWRRHCGRHPPVPVLGTIRSGQVDVAAQWFPPCMAHLHWQLRRQHRLHHHDRIQYTLFLKEAGMSVEEALDFWQGEYSIHADGETGCGHSWDKDGRRYTYSIRHLYGLQGSRRQYHAHSCRSLQARTPGPREHGGCPFVHFDPAGLGRLLSVHVTSTPTLNRILDLKHQGRFSQACSVLLAHRTQRTAATTRDVEPDETAAEVREGGLQCTMKPRCRGNGCGEDEGAGRGKTLNVNEMNTRAFSASGTVVDGMRLKEKEALEDKQTGKTFCSRNCCKSECDASRENVLDIEEVVQTRKSSLSPLSSSPEDVGGRSGEEVRKSTENICQVEDGMELSEETFQGSLTRLLATDQESFTEQTGLLTAEVCLQWKASGFSTQRAGAGWNVSSAKPDLTLLSNTACETDVQSRQEFGSTRRAATSTFADIDRTREPSEAGCMDSHLPASVRLTAVRTTEHSGVQDVSTRGSCSQMSVPPAHWNSSNLDAHARADSETERSGLSASLPSENSSLCLKDVCSWTESPFSFPLSQTDRRSCPSGGVLSQESVCENESKSSSESTPDFMSVSSTMDLFEGSQQLDRAGRTPSPSSPISEDSSSESWRQSDRTVGSPSPSSFHEDLLVENIVESSSAGERGQVFAYSSDSDGWSRHTASDLFDTDSNEEDAEERRNRRDWLHPRPLLQNSPSGWCSEEDLFEESQQEERKWSPPSPPSPSEDSLTTQSSEDLFGDTSEYENEHVILCSSPDRTLLAFGSAKSSSEEDDDETADRLMKDRASDGAGLTSDVGDSSFEDDEDDTTLNCSEFTRDCASDLSVDNEVLEENDNAENTNATTELSPPKGDLTRAEENVALPLPVDVNTQAVQKPWHQPQPLGTSEDSRRASLTEGNSHECWPRKPSNKRRSGDGAEDILNWSQVKCLEPRKRRRLFASPRLVSTEMGRQEGNCLPGVKCVGSVSIPQTTGMEGLGSNFKWPCSGMTGACSSDNQPPSCVNERARSVISRRQNQRTPEVRNAADVPSASSESPGPMSPVFNQDTRQNPGVKTSEPEDAPSMHTSSTLSVFCSSSDGSAVSCKPDSTAEPRRGVGSMRSSATPGFADCTRTQAPSPADCVKSTWTSSAKPTAQKVTEDSGMQDISTDLTHSEKSAIGKGDKRVRVGEGGDRHVYGMDGEGCSCCARGGGAGGNAADVGDAGGNAHDGADVGGDAGGNAFDGAGAVGDPDTYVGAAYNSGSRGASSRNVTSQDISKTREDVAVRTLSMGPGHTAEEEGEEEGQHVQTRTVVRKPVDFYASFLRLLEGLSH